MPLHVYAQDSTRQQTKMHSFTFGKQAVNVNRSDSWFSEDKYRHLVGGMFATVLLSQSGERVAEWDKKKSETFAVGTTIGLLFVKELYDRKKAENHFCWKDIAAGVTGVLIGVILIRSQ
jgi:uncharacterized protein YfiM (DUF2279 family)